MIPENAASSDLTKNRFEKKEPNAFKMCRSWKNVITLGD